MLHACNELHIQYILCTYLYSVVSADFLALGEKNPEEGIGEAMAVHLAWTWLGTYYEYSVISRSRSCTPYSVYCSY